MEQRVTEKNPNQQLSDLIDRINPLIAGMGYEVVQIEVQTHRQKTLRLFIDFTITQEGRSVGIEDCVTVTKTLDEPLDQMPEVEAIFRGNYELEVSSPGVDRPLRTAKDFERFSGREIRVHTYRPLKAEEIGNTVYLDRNPKQKNFYGTLKGIVDNRVRLEIDPTGGDPQARQKSKKSAGGRNGGKGKQLPETDAQAHTNSAEEVAIPLPLISKANLEPRFEFDERE